MNWFTAIAAILGLLSFSLSCISEGQSSSPFPDEGDAKSVWSGQYDDYPKIASWLAKKDEIIASNRPYDLVMSGWFTLEEAVQIKAQNPDVVLLAGLSINWVWDNPEWQTFLLTVAGYGRNEPYVMSESMYLHSPDGARCVFGWASEQWGHEEIFAMDPRNSEWAELIISFYKNVLEQPQHDGIIIDMLTEKSWCSDAISDGELVEATTMIFKRIKEINVKGKPVIVNSGRDFSEIDDYSEYIDGYLMENFMGSQVKSTFDDGLKAGEGGFKVILAVDTDDTGVKDLNKMRLGLVLSLLKDNMYFTYDFGPRDHGQAWWFNEYDVNLGNPKNDYYKKGDTYYRDFEKGIVVASPYNDTAVSFSREFTDVTTGSKTNTFYIEKGDGRIFLVTE